MHTILLQAMPASSAAGPMAIMQHPALAQTTLNKGVSLFPLCVCVGVGVCVCVCVGGGGGGGPYVCMHSYVYSVVILAIYLGVFFLKLHCKAL